MKHSNTSELKTKSAEVIQELKKVIWLHHDKRFDSVIKKYLKPENQIVDLGCGSGYLAERLIKEFNLKNIELADLDDFRSIETVKQLPHYQVNFNLEKLPFDNSSKDAAFALQVLEHLENGFNFVNEISRILKKDGLFILSIPNGYNIFSRIEFLFKAEIEGYSKDENHISFFPKDIFFNILFTDFQPVDKFYCQRYLKLSKFGLGKLINLKYPKTEFFSPKVCYIFKKL